HRPEGRSDVERAVVHDAGRLDPRAIAVLVGPDDLAALQIQRVQPSIPAPDEDLPIKDRGRGADDGIHGVSPDLLAGRLVHRVHTAIEAPEDHLPVGHGGGRADYVARLEVPDLFAGVGLEGIDTIVGATHVHDAIYFDRSGAV